VLAEEIESIAGAEMPGEAAHGAAATPHSGNTCGRWFPDLPLAA